MGDTLKEIKKPEFVFDCFSFHICKELWSIFAKIKCIEDKAWGYEQVLAWHKAEMIKVLGGLKVKQEEYSPNEMVNKIFDTFNKGLDAKIAEVDDET